MAVEVAVDADRVEPAHQVGALGDCLVEQRGGAGRAGDAALREGDDLDADEIAEALADRQHGLEVLEAELVVDVDMAAHVQRAARHHLLHEIGAGLGLRHGAGRPHLALGLDASATVLPAAWFGTHGRPSRVLSRWMWPSTSGGRAARPASESVGGRNAADAAVLDLDIVPASVGQPSVRIIRFSGARPWWRRESRS
jgi:hypothetical protein